MKKLAIVTTHPIQYYAPVFRLLAQQLDLKVFYTWGENSIEAKFDPGFGKVVKWDLPLLDGYSFEFLKNTADDPGTHHFKGIVNPNIIDRLQSFHPDAILVYGWSYSSHLKVLRYFKGKCPVWFRGDSNLMDTQTSWKQVLRKLFLKRVYRCVDYAFYVGSANKEYYRKYGLAEKQLIFAPHAVDNQRFQHKRDEEVSALKKQLNLSQDDILILFAGKLEPKKNPLILLKAFSRLQKEDVHLLFVGNGILETEVKATVKSFPADVQARVHFLDFQNQQGMPVVYQCCDLFCLPSQGPGETWGLAVNEAMASGKAVLVSDKVGCSRDLITEENGLIFESNNLQELILKLELLCSSKQRLEERGIKGQELILSWSFEKQVEAFEKRLADQTE